MKKEKMIEAPQEIKDCVRKIMQYKVIQVACDKLVDEGEYTEIECNAFKKACDIEIDKLEKELEVWRNELRQKDSGDLH